MKCSLSSMMALVLGFSAVMLGGCGAASEPRFQSLGIGGGGGMFAPASSPHDPNLMFVSCDMGGFYRSTDGGKTWRMYNVREIGSSTQCRPSFHPADANIVYMANKDVLYISRNRGQSFERTLQAAPWAGATIRAINLDRGQGDTMFVGSDKGLWRSADGGKSFVPCQDISGTVIWTHVDQSSPKDKRVVLCGTTAGFFRSDDGGQTWIAPSPSMKELAGFAAGSDARSVHCYATTKEGVFVSEDRGQTWTACEGGLPKTQFAFAAMAENSPRTCYVTDKGTKWGVYKTTDGGKTWLKVFRFMANEPQQNVQWGFLAMDISPAWGGPAIGFSVNPGNADYAMYTNTGEMFITHNGGKDWRWACAQPVGKAQPGGAWQPVGLEVTTCWNYVFDPFDKNRTFICYTDIGLARSEDRGKTWLYSDNGSPWNNTTYRMIPDPQAKGIFYAAAANKHDVPGWGQIESIRYGGGVQKSTDHGQTWRPIANGLPSEKFPCVSMEMDLKSPVDSRVLYASMFGDGVYKSIDGGANWQRASDGLGTEGNRHVYALYLHPNGTLYCLITGKRKGPEFGPVGGLYKSTDAGKTWTCITEGLTVYWPTEFLVDSQDSDTIWLSSCDVPKYGTGGLYKTTDGGKTWKAAMTAKDFDRTIQSYVHCFAIAQHPKRAGVMYLSVWTHGLYISQDSGKTWKLLKGIPFATPNRISFDPQDADTIYVTTYGGGVWKGPWNGY